MPDGTLLGPAIGFFGLIVWLFLCWRMGMFTRGAMSHSRYLEEILNETKQQNAALEAVLTKIDARLSRLEAIPPGMAKPDA